jgi:hypothetical protein
MGLIISVAVAHHGGIVGRGVLIDYADWCDKRGLAISAFESVPVELADVKAIAAEYGIEFHTGDILFLRTGYIREYEKLAEEAQKALAVRDAPNFIGLEAGKGTLKWLWDHQFAAMASDCPSFERAPIAGPHANLDEMLHQWCLAGWGMPIGELFDLERLAAHCKETKRYSFFISSVPLKVSNHSNTNS